jgi:uncharacterized protein (DUF2235 family)
MSMTDMPAGAPASGKKRIILLLDGTWNDRDFGNSDTNIVRLQRIIAETLRDRKDTGDVRPQDPTKITSSIDDVDGTINIVFYERGIGTSWQDRLKGGIFGSGMPQKIRNAYRFLSFHYEPGCEVFVFGFSRGAYTARSLVGFIGAAGLLRCQDCTKINEALAWAYYRTPPNERLPGVHAALTPYVHDRDKFRISCVGVFDTVGALGVPLHRFKLFNRDKYQFHDVDLSSITELNLHAVAIDEHRQPFEATVWRRPKFKRYLSRTEQVWFPGVHADVGGSYIPEADRRRDNPRSLDDVTLDWMLKRVTKKFPRFPADPKKWKLIEPGWATAAQHESRLRFYRLMPLTLRSIGNYPIRDLPRFHYNGCYDRHAVPMWEKVHISSLKRLGETVETRTGKQVSRARYLPQNLISALPVIQATYREPVEDAPDDMHYQIRIVNWDGEEFLPTNPDHRTAARTIVRTALERMK